MPSNDSPSSCLHHNIYTSLTHTASWNFPKLKNNLQLIVSWSLHIAGKPEMSFSQTPLQMIILKRCHDSFSNLLSINFYNIHNFLSIFSVEHHLSSFKHCLFHNETHYSEVTDGNLYSLLSCFLYPKFQAKAGYCIWVGNQITYLILLTLVILSFSFTSHSVTIYICAVYL